MICRRLDEVKAAVSPGNSNDWLAHYYQFANRLATLWFLLDHGVKARLLHLCFVGDDHFPDVAHDAEEWREGRRGIGGLEAMDRWFGRPFVHPIESRLHVVFVPVFTPAHACE